MSSSLSHLGAKPSSETQNQGGTKTVGTVKPSHRTGILASGSCPYGEYDPITRLVTTPES